MGYQKKLVRVLSETIQEEKIYRGILKKPVQAAPKYSAEQHIRLFEYMLRVLSDAPAGEYLVFDVDAIAIGPAGTIGCAVDVSRLIEKMEPAAVQMFAWVMYKIISRTRPDMIPRNIRPLKSPLWKILRPMLEGELSTIEGVKKVYGAFLEDIAAKQDARQKKKNKLVSLLKFPKAVLSFANRHLWVPMITGQVIGEVLLAVRGEHNPEGIALFLICATFGIIATAAYMIKIRAFKHERFVNTPKEIMRSNGIVLLATLAFFGANFYVAGCLRSPNNAVIDRKTNAYIGHLIAADYPGIYRISTSGATWINIFQYRTAKDMYPLSGTLEFGNTGVQVAHYQISEDKLVGRTDVLTGTYVPSKVLSILTAETMSLYNTFVKDSAERIFLVKGKDLLGGGGDARESLMNDFQKKLLVHLTTKRFPWSDSPIEISYEVRTPKK